METQNIKNAGVELTNSQYYYKKKIIYLVFLIILSLLIQFMIYAKFDIGRSYKGYYNVVLDYRDNPVFIPQNRQHSEQTVGLVFLGLVNFITLISISILSIVMDFKIFNSIKKSGEFLMEVE